MKHKIKQGRDEGEEILICSDVRRTSWLQITEWPGVAGTERNDFAEFGADRITAELLAVVASEVVRR